MGPATAIVKRTDVELRVSVSGNGPAVLLLPGGGRGAEDFGSLASELEAAGFRAAAMNPRGVGGSVGPLDGVTLHDFAADAAAVVEDLGDGSAHVVGHAFGNRVARCLAADRPELVRGVALLACGGRIQGDRRGGFGPIEETLDDETFAAMREVMFSDRSDRVAAEAWRAGWWPRALAAQATATLTTPVEEWWSAGVAPLLVIQGLDDRVAPPENGRLLAAEHPDRVTLVELEDAGHAILIERPLDVARHVLAFVAGR
jgi:pimeloyl-ACP methyl ester carboxylesterase